MKNNLSISIVSQATNFDLRISKSQAEKLLKQNLFNDDVLGVIMCKEYGEDEDWIGLTSDDLINGFLDTDYKTFEISLNKAYIVSKETTKCILFIGVEKPIKKKCKHCNTNYYADNDESEQVQICDDCFEEMENSHIEEIYEFSDADSGL